MKPKPQKWRQISLNGIAAILLGCGATGPDSHVPDLGRYSFTASWFVAGFADPATVTGELVILTTGETITYRITLAEALGPVVKTGSATWSEANGYVLGAGPVGRAGVWSLLPHLDRAGGTYTCTGNAINSNLQGSPMTCAFVYVGP